jgi:hypothetical protein
MNSDQPNGNTANPRIVFEGGFDERAAHEAEARGYRAGVYVEFDDRRRYEVVFYDPVRLVQDLKDEVDEGNPFISAPGLIILPDVTLSNMQAAIAKLVRERYFESIVPCAAASDQSLIEPTQVQTR